MRTINSGLWLDEFETAWATRSGGVLETWRRVSIGSGGSQSPVFYAIVWWVRSVLGESELALRLPSLLSSVGSLWVVHRLVRRTSGARAAAAVLLVMSVHPFLVTHGQWARAYAFAELLLLLSVYGLVRAVETGAARHRALAWGAALLAVYTHKLSVTVFLVVLLTPLLTRERRAYTLRKLLFDSGLALLAGIPALIDLIRYRSTGPETKWFPDPTWSSITHSIFPGLTWLLLGAVGVLALSRALPGPRRPARREGRALTIVGALLVATLLLFLGAFELMGTRALYGGYMGAASLGIVLLVPALLERIPRSLGFAFVLCASLLAVHQQNLSWLQEWREAGAELSAIAPQPEEPVLAWQGYTMGNHLLQKDLPPEVIGRMLAPLELRVGHPPPSPPRDYVVMPPTWTKRLAPYFERELVPRLRRCRRFHLVAHPGYTESFTGWLRSRFSSQFVLTYRSRVFLAPVLISTFERPAEASGGRG